LLYHCLPVSKHSLVELRPIVEADLADWYAYLSMREVYEHTSWNLSSADDLAGYVEQSATPSAESRLRLAVAERSSGKLVGTVGFHSIAPQDRRAELAYDLAPRMWGQGLATYLATLAVRWAHEQADIARVQATVLQSNARSIAVLNRCDFEFEGVLKSFRMVRGEPGDFCMYAHIALACRVA
jgi:ribosomal-protein-alanine N-acetyltransferase